jgi:hypothetical protein
MTTVVFDLDGVVASWDPVLAVAEVVGHERARALRPRQRISSGRRRFVRSPVLPPEWDLVH